MTTAAATTAMAGPAMAGAGHPLPAHPMGSRAVKGLSGGFRFRLGVEQRRLRRAAAGLLSQGQGWDQSAESSPQDDGQQMAAGADLHQANGCEA